MGVAAAQAFDRDATRPIGTPFSSAPSPPSPSAVVIRGLPLNTSEESLRLMAVFSKELTGVQMLAVETDDQFRSAIMNFKTQAGAQQAKDILNGKSNITNDAELIVELLPTSTSASTRRLTGDAAGVSASTSAASSATSSGPSLRQQSRFNGTFQSLEKMSPPMNGVYATTTELPAPESSTRYQSIFSPQSPIGNHLTDRTRISGKTLIRDVVDDEDTGELLKDPVAYAESGATAQRRATAPQLPITSRMAGLSLNTAAQGPPPMPSYNHPGTMSTMSAHSATMSPVMGGGGGGRGGMDFQSRHFNAKRHNYPPANPADQNPPCNTLYVGNLPIDTSEEELKAMFSKQRGYKRLCFRTKQNGPMCFVEFEDVSFATKALHELYGQPLHNSVKGGIRLSFSKNPLGVRSGQTPGYGNAGSAMSGMNSMVPGAGNGFTSASGPPPGLSAPPGLQSRTGNYGASTPNGSNGYTVSGGFPSTSNGWGPSSFGNNAVTNGGLGPIGSNSNGSSYLPPHMMGR